jgi:hypothetical protein
MPARSQAPIRATTPLPSPDGAPTMAHLLPATPTWPSATRPAPAPAPRATSLLPARAQPQGPRAPGPAPSSTGPAAGRGAACAAAWLTLRPAAAPPPRPPPSLPPAAAKLARLRRELDEMGGDEREAALLTKRYQCIRIHRETSACECSCRALQGSMDQRCHIRQRGGA